MHVSPEGESIPTAKDLGDVDAVVEVFMQLAEHFGIPLDVSSPQALRDIAGLACCLQGCAEKAREGLEPVELNVAIANYYHNLPKARSKSEQSEIANLKDVLFQVNKNIIDSGLPQTIDQAMGEVSRRAAFIRLFAKTDLSVEVFVAITMYWPGFYRRPLAAMSQSCN